MSSASIELPDEGSHGSSRTEHDGYRTRAAMVLAELTHSDNGLEGSADVVARHLPTVLDPRFIAELLAPVSIERPGRRDKVRLWMAQSAIIEALQSQQLSEIGQAGLGLLLLMLSLRSSSGIRDFVARYGGEIEVEAINYIAAASNYIREDARLLAQGADDFSRGLLEIANVLSGAWAWTVIEEPLVMAFFSHDTKAFLHRALELASMPVVDEKLPARLNSLWKLLSSTDNSGHTMLAICAWTRSRAMELLVDLAGEEIDVVADVLRDNLRKTLVEEWAVKAGKEGREEAASFAAFIGTQFAWGMSEDIPPPPYPALLKLAELRDLTGLPALVCEEPYLLHEQVLRDLQTGSDFALISELWNDSEQMVQKGRALTEMAAALRQSENNPLIELAGTYATGKLSTEDAQERARILGGRNVLHVAGAVGISLDDLGGNLAMYMAVTQVVAWAADAVSDNPLLQAYANARLALAMIDTRPHTDVLAMLDDAYDVGVQLGHPMLRSEITYNIGQMHERTGNISDARRCYSHAYLSCLPLPPPFGRFDALLSLIDLAGRGREGPDRVEMRRLLKLLEAYDIQHAPPIYSARYLASWQKLNLMDGNYEAADTDAERLYELQAQVPSSSNLADLAVSGKVNRWISQREYQKAIEVLEEQARSKQNLGEFEQALSAYNGILALCNDHNLDAEFSRTFAAYTLAVAHVPGATERPLHLYFEAVWYQIQGSYEQALSLFRRALGALNSNDISLAFRPHILSHIDACLVHMGELNEVGEARERGAEVESEQPRHDVTSDATEAERDINDGLLYARKGQRGLEEGKAAQAVGHYRRAEVLWKRALTREGLPSDVRNGLHYNLELLATRLVELGQQVEDSPKPPDYEEHVREALIQIEVRRNSLLAVLLSIESVPLVHRHSYREALRASSRSDKRWPSRRPIFTNEGKDADGEEREDESPSIEHNSVQEILGRIKEEYPESALRITSSPHTLREVREALAGLSETAFIYLETRSTGTVAIIVSETALELLELPLSLDDVTRLRAAFRRDAPRDLGSAGHDPVEVAIQHPKAFSQPSLAATIDQQAQFIGIRLWTDLHPRLQQLGVTQLVLMPDAFLALLPLHAARLPGVDAEREWVLDHYDIVYSQSAGAFALCTRRAGERMAKCQKWSAVVQGAYSANGMPPSMASGVLSGLILERELGEGDIVWTREIGPDPRDAISRLEQAISESQFLYVYCHGQFDPAHPHGASLLIDTTPPRAFTADEVVDLSPALARSRLIILAVCEGGEVVMQVTSDYQGFPMAFLEAGAPVVLAAPWKLNEPATPLLLSAFFRHIAQGETVARALRRAQIWLRDANRGELIAELRLMDKQITWSSPELQDEKIFARSMFRAAAEQLEYEGEKLTVLLAQVEGSEYESAVAALWQARDPAGVWASRPALLDLAGYLGRSFRDDPNIDVLRDRIKGLLDFPFASPYYWGGLQAIGAGLSTSITKVGGRS